MNKKVKEIVENIRNNNNIINNFCWAEFYSDTMQINPTNYTWQQAVKILYDLCKPILQVRSNMQGLDYCIKYYGKAYNKALHYITPLATPVEFESKYQQVIADQLLQYPEFLQYAQYQLVTQGDLPALQGGYTAKSFNMAQDLFITELDFIGELCGAERYLFREHNEFCIFFLKSVASQYASLHQKDAVALNYAWRKQWEKQEAQLIDELDQVFQNWHKTILLEDLSTRAPA